MKSVPEESRERVRDDFAPTDYTDGRDQYNWQTKYPDKARTCIRLEAAYLVVVFLFYLTFLLVTVLAGSNSKLKSLEDRWTVAAVKTSNPSEASVPSISVPQPVQRTTNNAEAINSYRTLNVDSASEVYLFLGYLLSWIGGAIGGCLFGLKWMYHSVAKGRWHEDRRLWRILTPHMSGALSLFMMIMVSSGLLQIFDNTIITRHTAVLGFSFLVGYFSDKALAKMAEVADTFFGASKS